MKVLLVDDEPLARARMRRLLAELDDCDCVAEAANGVAAIAAWQQYQPDVILLDIRMPLMDGLEAARIMAASETPPAIMRLRRLPPRQWVICSNRWLASRCRMRCTRRGA